MYFFLSASTAYHNLHLPVPKPTNTLKASRFNAKLTFGFSFIVPHHFSTSDSTVTLKFFPQSSIIDRFFQVLDVQVNTLKLIDTFHLLLLEATPEFGLAFRLLLSTPTEQDFPVHLLLIDFFHCLMKDNGSFQKRFILPRPWETPFPHQDNINFQRG